MNPVKLLKTILPIFILLPILILFLYFAPKPAFATCSIPSPLSAAETGKSYTLFVLDTPPGDYTLHVYAGTDDSQAPIYTETINGNGINPVVFSIPGNIITDALTSTGISIVVIHAGQPCLPAGLVWINVTPPGGGGGAGANPCGPEGKECKTALGNIPTDASAFAGTILTLAIGVAGGLAFILMVIGSIRVLTSSGDPQRVAGGRDMIVAAVAGLLFLIFSFLILQFIGGDILELGFGGFDPIH